MQPYLIMKNIKTMNIEAVMDECSIMSFLFTGFWLAFNKLYDIFLLWLIIFLIFPGIKMTITLSIIVYLFGSDLKVWTLRYKGYIIDAIIMANSEDDAIKLYIGQTT